MDQQIAGNTSPERVGRKKDRDTARRRSDHEDTFLEGGMKKK